MGAPRLPQPSQLAEDDRVTRGPWVITGHAIHRAQTRWIEPSDADAIAAIVRVLEQGEFTKTKRGGLYLLGSRRICVQSGVVKTVTVARLKLVKRLARLSRKDMKERRR